ncbi:b75a2463-8b93-4943-8bb0-b7e6c7c11526 [Sclerotinia trifoliorum]|uniref:B75a2463-8b93-4943-8bb0-b7e6c7c11526 n=1 Tax=Sclerotinia trifoliorum TaxID=28548 RepID=A0A8H2VU45_9HELO|nr:b75a2463-8b93-4943-8bb0-b7e6c7c11526 [Sclerotinia trifoliorum]
MKLSTIFLSLLITSISSRPSPAVQRESGITVGADGSTNLGGEAGITKKPNGSTSVGGESGINVGGGTNSQPQQAAGARTGNGGNKNGTDGLTALIGALNGASSGNSTGKAKPTGTRGNKPKGTGNANGNTNLPPGVASDSSLASIFGALEGAK